MQDLWDFVAVGGLHAVQSPLQGWLGNGVTGLRCILVALLDAEPRGIQDPLRIHQEWREIYAEQIFTSQGTSEDMARIAFGNGAEHYETPVERASPRRQRKSAECPWAE